MSREEVNVLYYGDADYPLVMMDVPVKCDIVRVGRLECVPLYQVLNKLREPISNIPKCRHCYLDENSGNWHIECEEVAE